MTYLILFFKLQFLGLVFSEQILAKSVEGFFSNRVQIAPQCTQNLSIDEISAYGFCKNLQVTTLMTICKEN